MLKLSVRKHILPFRFINFPFLGEWDNSPIVYISDEKGRTLQLLKEDGNIIVFGYGMSISYTDFAKITTDRNSNIVDLLKASQNVKLISTSFSDVEAYSKENNLPWGSIPDSSGNKIYFVVSAKFSNFANDIDYLNFNLKYA